MYNHKYLKLFLINQNMPFLFSSAHKHLFKLLFNSYLNLTFDIAILLIFLILGYMFYMLWIKVSAK